MPHIAAGVWGEKHVEVGSIVELNFSFGDLFKNAEVLIVAELVFNTESEVDLLQLVSVSCLVALEYKENIN